MTRYCAVAAAQGESPRAIDGLDLPETTADALAKAGGALIRTVYLAIAGDRCASLLGYHRPHTAQQKLTAIGGDRALWDGLITFAQQHSLAEPGITVVKYDICGSSAVDADPQAAIAVSSAVDAPFSDAASCAAATAASTPNGMREKTMPAGVASDGNAVPLPYTDATAHYRQTTEFTCGPVAVLTAMHRLGIAPEPTRDEELQMWREATIAVACEPYGLALAAERRGAHPTIRVSDTGPVLHPDSRLGILDAAMAADTQQTFARQVRERGIPVETGAFDADDIAALVDDGHMVVVLIDELHMHGEACPHWVAVTGRDQSTGALLIDDPWTDAEFGETAVDAFQMPVFPKDLDLMIRYDNPRSAQAMLVF